MVSELFLVVLVVPGGLVDAEHIVDQGQGLLYGDSGGDIPCHQLHQGARDPVLIRQVRHLDTASTKLYDGLSPQNLGGKLAAEGRKLDLVAILTSPSMSLGGFLFPSRWLKLYTPLVWDASNFATHICVQ